MGKSKYHIEFLDDIRGFAILLVFVFHCLGAAFGQYELSWDNWFRDFSTSTSFLALLPATFGWAGVAIFFVVSGFCIHLSYLQASSKDWRTFYIRRFFRIYPPYLLALIVFAFVFPRTRLSFHSLSDWAQLGSHLLLLHNFDEKLIFGINPSFWSIAVEAQLYLLYPLLITVAKRIGWRKTLIVLCILELSLRGFAGIYATVTGNEVPRWVSGSPLFYWYSWAIGAALAEAFAKKQVLPFSTTPPILWFSLAICTWLIRPLAPCSFLLFSVLTATVIAKSLNHNLLPTLQNSVLAHFRVLGVWSYSFYLLHQPLIGTIAPALQRMGFTPLHPLAMFLLCVCTYPAIVFLSMVYYEKCERYSMALGKFFLSKVSK